MGESLRITVRVRPGASRTAVGGAYGEPPARQLVVAVCAGPVAGAANMALLAAVAAAFELRRGDVRIVGGVTNRTKVLELDGDPAVLGERLTELLAA